MKNLTVFFLATILWQHTFAQDSLTILQAKEDLNIFKTSMLEAHPGLNIYSTELDFSKQCDDYLKVIEQNDKISQQRFYQNLKRITASIQDGHTDLSASSKMIDYNHLLPFHFEISGDALLITKNFSDVKNIKLPARVLTINGYKTADIIQKLNNHTSANGDFQSFKTAYNEAIFSRQFGELIEATPTYDLTIKVDERPAYLITVTGITDKELYTNSTEVQLVFTPFVEKNYAILKVKTFQYVPLVNRGIDYHQFLENSFKQLRKENIEHLIIDLRDNYGGHSILALTLYSYLTEGGFTWVSSSFTKLHQPITFAEDSNYPEGNYPFLKTHKVEKMDNDWWKLTDGIDSKPFYNSDFIYKAKNKLESIKKNKFKGKVYLLTNGLTFSAASTFTNLSYINNEATIIGTAFGGADNVFCGGGFLHVELPNTGFRMDIPTMRREIRPETNSTEIKLIGPHSIIFEASDADTALDAAKEIILKK